MTRLRLSSGCLAVCLLLSGCSSSPKISYYTLQGPSGQTSGTIQTAVRSISVRVNLVTLPEMVDRPQMVVRLSDNRVEISDTSRWAEPLKGQIARELALQLARTPGLGPVTLVGQAVTGDPDVTVSVDILDFESVQGSSVTLQGSWVLRGKGASVPSTANFELMEPVRGDGFEPLVAAHRKALRRLSRLIGQSILASGG